LSFCLKILKRKQFIPGNSEYGIRRQGRHGAFLKLSTADIGCGDTRLVKF
jgi:hypothetical protein